jgi:hypothetical protein
MGHLYLTQHQYVFHLALMVKNVTTPPVIVNVLVVKSQLGKNVFRSANLPRIVKVKAVFLIAIFQRMT